MSKLHLVLGRKLIVVYSELVFKWTSR
ncbi:hypothetical protein NC652_023693 [Populus alba x Populus x berolinensis]|nr:hypothetical protein NC652_023693 [Populus alba x Populus x berolinensis]